MDIKNARYIRQLKSVLAHFSGELRLACGHVNRNFVASLCKLIAHIATGAPNCLTTEPGGILRHDTRTGVMNSHIPVGDRPGQNLFYPAT